jgi:hypothetical protein
MVARLIEPISAITDCLDRVSMVIPSKCGPPAFEWRLKVALGPLSALTASNIARRIAKAIHHYRPPSVQSMMPRAVTTTFSVLGVAMMRPGASRENFHALRILPPRLHRRGVRLTGPGTPVRPRGHDTEMIERSSVPTTTGDLAPPLMSGESRTHFVSVDLRSVG